MENDMKNKPDITEQIISDRIKTSEWSARREELFTQALDRLASFPPAERITILGGIKDCGKPGETVVSPKKYADQQSVAQIRREIATTITSDQIAAAQSQRLAEAKAKQRQAVVREFLQFYPDLSKSQLELLCQAEETISDLSAYPVVNKRGLRKNLSASLVDQKPTTLVYIRCPRFAYPGGSLFIIPDLQDFTYTDKKGNSVTRFGAKVNTWFATSQQLSQVLGSLNIPTTPLIVMADTDLSDVRSMAKNDTNIANCLSFTERCRKQYPDLQIVLASELETSRPEVMSKYRQLFWQSAAYLLRNSNPQTLRKYGLSPQIIQLMKQTSLDNFTLPITDTTFERAVIEEQASQIRSLPDSLCTFALISVNTALRIARDIAQIGVLLPSVNSDGRVIYICDRALKAVDFGYIGNKLLGQPLLPTIFQRYEE